MEVVSGPLGQPALEVDLLGLMSARVVQDQVDIQFGLDRLINLAEKSQELLGSVPIGDAAHDLTCANGQCRRSRILINTFMVARDYHLVEFVKRVSQICQGKAYFTNTRNLARYLLLDFMNKKSRIGLGSPQPGLQYSAILFG